MGPVQSSPGVKHTLTVGQDASSALDDEGSAGTGVSWAADLGFPLRQ
jgi:hypothetical protein